MADNQETVTDGVHKQESLDIGNLLQTLQDDSDDDKQQTINENKEQELEMQNMPESKKDANDDLRGEVDELRQQINKLNSTISNMTGNISNAQMSPSYNGNVIASTSVGNYDDFSIVKATDKRTEGAWLQGSCFGDRIKYRLNPVVFFVSTIVIWGFVLWCVLDERAGIKIGKVQTWIVDSFSWLYVGAVALFTCFMIFLAIHPRYSQICLGKPGEKPKYNMVTWFSMLFSAGYGIGLYFYGVAESVLHFRDAQEGWGRYSYLPPQLQAVSSLNLSWFHGGFCALSVYCLVGLSIGYLSHRHGMPMTMRTCFYPLIGDKIYGFIGDFIDISAVVATMFGLTTSLGLGVLQLNSGLSRVSDNWIEQNTDTQIVIIWIITIMATISVVTGVDKGIKYLSQFNFAFGCILLLYLFFVGESFFLLNLLTETIGYHIQNIPELMFDTDTFEQAGFDAGSNYSSWMSWWTIFYWGWWIAWSPFVGIFIAEISRGRTVRAFIIGNMLIPTIVVNVWTTIMGGLGLWMEWKAMDLGLGDNYCLDPITDGKFTRLSCEPAEDQMFTLIEFYPLGDFISIVALIGIVGYFVTSSDSASYVIDLITSNGQENPPKLQRVFWALTEGAVATALLAAGGEDALAALQTVSIAAALPFTFVLIMMVYSLLVALDSDKEMLNAPDNVFAPLEALENATIGHVGDRDQVPNDTPLPYSDPKANNTVPTVSVIEEEKHMDGDEDGGAGNDETNALNGGNSEGIVTDYNDVNEAYMTRSNVDFATFNKPWKVDFFDGFFNNWKLSLLSLFLPCVVHYYNAMKVGLFDECGIFWRLAIIVPPVVFVVFQIIGGTLNSGFAYLGWTIYIFIGLLGTWIRMEIRFKYKLKGNSCCDAMAHLCCFWFAVSQEAIECDSDISFATI